ncbi:hypothetical protein K440DRAFT_610429 [Wilcoxina mikolae CBS 423.85]|nr:hypothetical protein K440DRAFT_610429 [Wilcoxina mikolae CBS 423.85]
MIRKIVQEPGQKHDPGPALKTLSPNLPSSYQTAPPSPPALSSFSSSQTPKKRKGKRIVFLGAPTLDRIDMSTLIDTPPSPPRISSFTSPSSSASGPNWRILHRFPKRLKTGFTQNTYGTATPQEYAAPPSSSAAESIDDHSYFLSTSQPSRADETLDLSEYSDDTGDTTFLTTQDPSFLNPTQDPDRPPIPPLVTLTDLEDLPRSHVISAALTNSLSITALVAVLSIAEPRTVTTKFGRKAQVITLTVGDPTHAPFRIDVWLELRPKSVDKMELKAVVKGLRVQDVIVVKNLRLGVWKELVFGTTWRVGCSGGSAVWMVHRVRCEGSEERRRWRRRWDDSILAERKVAKTVKWVEEFVGSGPGVGINGRMLGDEEEIPGDTQRGDVSF